MSTNTKPRTVDNLGPQASAEYARNVERYEPQHIKDSLSVSQRTTVDVLKPYALSEFDQRFSSKQTSTWADFPPPPNYFLHARALFTHEFIPSMGNLETQETALDKLNQLETPEPQADQKQTLINYFQCLHHLAKTFDLVNSRRNQYQRG